ncbi:MAG: hypothetical protein JKX69_13110, partial [Rhodobacteraceae bacterium]|nr:hypothetical protein [Paracoccaceae bacterium]
RPPLGPSPSDIAASAMRGFAVPAPVPSPPVVAAPIVVPPPAPITPPQSSRVHGIEIGALVAQASSLSQRQPTNARPMPTPPAAPKRPAMPDIGAHGDRLQTMLQEIETAAANARQRTAPSNGRSGRKQT